jgi:hypothetical protein
MTLVTNKDVKLICRTILKTVLALAIHPRSVCKLQSPALTSFFWASTLIFLKQMLVNSCNCVSPKLTSSSTSQLQAFLNSKGCSVETVTIIRERSTGSGPFVFDVSHPLTFLAIRFIKVPQRVLVLPNSQVQNMLALSWIHFSLSSQCHLQLRMVLSLLKHFTRL